MTTRPSADLRRRVFARAGGRCEYCLIRQDDVASRHQPDHVIAEKHGGATDFENLALSCSLCNRRKGSDVAAPDPADGLVSPLFNPRTQHWADHFRLTDLRIEGLTPEGRATARLLQLNSPERLAERGELVRAGHYPVA